MPISNPTTAFVLIGLLLLAMGAVFFRAGFWPRRKGDTPYCAACGYSLVGIESGVCPECGGKLGEANIVRGERRRRPWLIMPGALLMLLGAAVVLSLTSSSVRNTDLYHYRPTAWVIKDARQSDPAMQYRAWTELERRDTNGQLSPEMRQRRIAAAIAELQPPVSATPSTLDLMWTAIASEELAGRLSGSERGKVIDTALASLEDPVASRPAREVLIRWAQEGRLDAKSEQKFIEYVLKEQGAGTLVPGSSELLTLLGDLYAANKLTHEQSHRFFTQSLPAEMKVRPIVIAGEEIPWRVSLGGNGPLNGPTTRWMTSTTHLETRVGNRKYPGIGEARVSGFGGWYAIRSIPPLPPGKHTIEATFKQEVFVGDQADGRKDATPCWSRMITLKGDVEVVATSPKDYVKLVENPLRLTQVTRSIRIRRLESMRRGGLRISLELRDPPMGVAFDVIARLNGREHRLGSIALSAGKQSSFVFSNESIDVGGATRADLIFRSSEAAARHTVDLFEIWKGEIVARWVEIQKEDNPDPRGLQQMPANASDLAQPMPVPVMPSR